MAVSARGMDAGAGLMDGGWGLEGVKIGRAWAGGGADGLLTERLPTTMRLATVRVCALARAAGRRRGGLV